MDDDQMPGLVSKLLTLDNPHVTLHAHYIDRFGYEQRMSLCMTQKADVVLDSLPIIRSGMMGCIGKLGATPIALQIEIGGETTLLEPEPPQSRPRSSTSLSAPADRLAYSLRIRLGALIGSDAFSYTAACLDRLGHLSVPLCV